MGHLASVQNLLHLIGGALNFEREDFPFRSGLYPFRFRLEPLTINSLAKYVYAEMPEGLTGDDIDEIKRRAMGSNMEDSLSHVGLLYTALANLFNKKNADGTYILAELILESEHLQAEKGWRRSNFKLNIVKTREDAVKLIKAIANQGEGLEDTANSHYRRFRKNYDAFPKENEWQPSLNLAPNPNTIPEDEMEAESETDSELETEGEVDFVMW